MGGAMTFPRDLTAQERSILDFILGHEWHGVEEVRAMLGDARVTDTCICGCGSINLTVTPPRGELTSPSPVPAEGVGYVDGEPVNVLLFVDEEGAYLEFIWYEERPGRLPEAHELETAEWRDAILVNLPPRDGG